MKRMRARIAPGHWALFRDDDLESHGEITVELPLIGEEEARRLHRVLTGVDASGVEYRIEREGLRLCIHCQAFSNMPDPRRKSYEMKARASLEEGRRLWIALRRLNIECRLCIRREDEANEIDEEVWEEARKKEEAEYKAWEESEWIAYVPWEPWNLSEEQRESPK